MNQQSNSPVANPIFSHEGRPASGPQTDKKDMQPPTGSAPSLIQACEVMSGILSYAERTSAGVSSRLLACDLIALSSGLIHAAGMASLTRRVNICSPAIAATVLGAMGDRISPAKNKVPSPARKGGKEASSKRKKKSLNRSQEAKPRPGKSGASKGARPVVKPGVSPLSAAEKARRALLHNAVRSLRRLSKEASSWSEEGPKNSFRNSRCAKVSGITPDQVRDKVSALSDAQVAGKPKGLSPLVFLGLIPNDSIDADLLRLRSEDRNKTRKEEEPSSGVSKTSLKDSSGRADRPSSPTFSDVVKGNKGKQPAVGTSSTKAVPIPGEPKGSSATSSSPAVGGSGLRAVAPYSKCPVTAGFVDPRLKHIPDVMRLLLRNLQFGPDQMSEGSQDDPIHTLVEWIGTKKGLSSEKRTFVLNGSRSYAVLKADGASRRLGFAYLRKVEGGRLSTYVLVSYATSPEDFEAVARSCTDSDVFTENVGGLHAIESPPRSTDQVASSQRRPSESSKDGPGVFPNVKGTRASSDVFSDLYSLSLADSRKG